MRRVPASRDAPGIVAVRIDSHALITQVPDQRAVHCARMSRRCLSARIARARNLMRGIDSALTRSRPIHGDSAQRLCCTAPNLCSAASRRVRPLRCAARERSREKPAARGFRAARTNWHSACITIVDRINGDPAAQQQSSANRLNSGQRRPPSLAYCKLASRDAFLFGAQA